MGVVVLNPPHLWPVGLLLLAGKNLLPGGGDRPKERHTLCTRGQHRRLQREQWKGNGGEDEGGGQGISVGSALHAL